MPTYEMTVDKDRMLLACVASVGYPKQYVGEIHIVLVYPPVHHIKPVAGTNVSIASIIPSNEN